MNAILFDFGFIKIYWYSFILFIAMLLAGSVALKESKKRNISEDFMINLFFFTIPISLIGARLYFVVFHLDYYREHISEIFKVWQGGLAIHGGILAGLIFIIFYSKKHKINTKRLLDIIVVSLLLGQAIGRWGNFFNGEAHGSLTSLESLQWLPNFIVEGMCIDGLYYQPTFLYESMWCLLGFILFLFIRRRNYLKLGQLTSLYMIWYGIGRFVIEWFRTDSLMFFNFKIAMVVSFSMIIIGIILYFVYNRGSKMENRYHDKEDVNGIEF